MAVSNADLACMIFLDCIEMGLGAPDGCDVDTLAAQDLIQPAAGGWSLTPRGQLLLHTLRSSACRRDIGG